MAITGTHALLYTTEPEALRACFRDVFGWEHVDAHDRWLIFALPPAELGVHPGESPAHELTFMCDDIRATMAELKKAKHVVVVGGGMVAHRLVEALRQRDTDITYRITVFAEEPQVAAPSADSCTFNTTRSSGVGDGSTG